MHHKLCPRRPIPARPFLLKNSERRLNNHESQWTRQKKSYLDRCLIHEDKFRRLHLLLHHPDDAVLPLPAVLEPGIPAQRVVTAGDAIVILLVLVTVMRNGQSVMQDKTPPGSRVGENLDTIVENGAVGALETPKGRKEIEIEGIGMEIERVGASEKESETRTVSVIEIGRGTVIGIVIRIGTGTIIAEMTRIASANARTAKPPAGLLQILLQQMIEGCQQDRIQHAIAMDNMQTNL